ncbi:MAG: hypothetical protein AB7P04_14485 [Bacteriovoracia bacterium]
MKLKQHVSTLTLIAALAAGALPLTPAFAGDDGDCEECGHHQKHWRNWSFTLSPLYQRNTRTSLNAAYAANGFAAPTQDLFGLSFQAVRNYESGVKLGFEFQGVGTGQTVGANEAMYNSGAFGVYVGYEFARLGNTSFTIGSGLGWSGSTVQMFSGGQDGRYTEYGFYANPALAIDQQVSDRVKIGVSGGYFAAISQGSETRGDTLALSDISPRGLEIQVNFTFGKFGEDAKSAEKKTSEEKK